MAGRVYLAMPFVATRTALWAALFAVALWDGIRHRGVRSRGFQLYWALVVSAGLFVLQEVVLLILAAESHGQTVNRATLGAYIFFADLATSFWFGILLTVAAGYWCVGGLLRREGEALQSTVPGSPSRPPACRAPLVRSLQHQPHHPGAAQAGGGGHPCGLLCDGAGGWGGAGGGCTMHGQTAATQASPRVTCALVCRALPHAPHPPTHIQAGGGLCSVLDPRL